MLNLQKNYLQKYQQIYPQNPQWNQIQYKLQLNLGNSSAYLKRVYSVFNPHFVSNFEKQSKGYIVYQAFVGTDDKGSNRIQRVCQKGYEFPASSTGLQFSIGQLDIDGKSKSEYQLLILRICPKRSYPCYQKQIKDSLSSCPQGFQSIYYVDKNEERGLYRHRFRLYKKSQVVPMYVIQFAFNQEHQKAFKQIICEKCQNQLATIFCSTQKVYFCKKCDYLHHKDKISAKHQRALLSQKSILDFGKCRNHPSNKNQIFCQNCSNSMCMSCTIYGDHSGGTMGSHLLHKIQNYYSGATKKLDQIDPNLDKRKYQLQKLLCYLDDQISVINQKTSKLQQQLKRYFQRALIQLQTISKQKLSILMADQLQVRRQYDYIQWMQSFLIYQKNVLPPNDFLIAWTKHEKHRKQVLNIGNIPCVTKVEPNIKILGSINVIQSLQDFNEDDEDYLERKANNRHLQKYKKSSGGKGPVPKELQQKHEKFRKKLIFFDESQQTK